MTLRGSFRSRARKESNKDLSGGKITSSIAILFQMKNNEVEEFVQRVKFHTSLRGLDILSDQIELEFTADLEAYRKRISDRNKQMLNMFNNEARTMMELERFLKFLPFGIRILPRKTIF